jgi:hypothetical protein
MIHIALHEFVHFSYAKSLADPRTLMIHIALHEFVHFSYAKSLADPRTSMIDIALCESMHSFMQLLSLIWRHGWLIDIALLCESVHTLMQHLLLQPGKRNSAWWCALQMHCSISPRLLCVGQGMRKGLFWEWGSNKRARQKPSLTGQKFLEPMFKVVTHCKRTLLVNQMAVMLFERREGTL